MLLVKSDASGEAGVMPDARLIADMEKFNEDMKKANVMLASEGLHASSKAARIRCNKATKKVTVVDGPFAEAKEIIAGFWVIQTKTKAEAIEWAKRVPFLDGEVEVRPLFELEDFPVDPQQVNEVWREKEQSGREAMSAQTHRGNKKMRFVGFVKADTDTESGALPESSALEAMGAFIEKATKAGVLLGGEGLKPTSEGAKVWYDGTKRRVVDGPFTETKELVAGYSILAVDSKAEAIEWSKQFVLVDASIRAVPEVECQIFEICEPEDFPTA
jgi:hypothetical protein